MKGILAILVLAAVLGGCKPSEEVSELTGKETTYALQPGSQYQISGIVTFKEKRNGTTLILVDLTGTSGTTKYPVHLHLGDLSTQGASVAALLNPLVGSTGKSETLVSQLADESSATYADLVKLSACIKIHLADSGPQKDIILAAGNVGAASSKSISNGRLGIAVCGNN
jgi:hypothetical protein